MTKGFSSTFVDKLHGVKISKLKAEVEFARWAVQVRTYIMSG
ncbi:hypothetical protein [Nostoc sp. 2RC]|nr:hypothetical protein [Nostoc sp. 2RC]